MSEQDVWNVEPIFRRLRLYSGLYSSKQKRHNEYKSPFRNNNQGRGFDAPGSVRKHTRCTTRFLDNPSSTHWEAVKRVFCYLAGARNFALTYGRERQDLMHHELYWCTVQMGASEEHRHAISGYVIPIDEGGTLVPTQARDRHALNSEGQYMWPLYMESRRSRRGYWSSARQSRSNTP
jgi:hypothetical protein